MKRTLGLIALAMPAAVLAQAATNGLTNYPDIPKAEPLTETVFGITVDDPYRWFEKADRRAELEKWVNASSLQTTTQLATLPGREALFKDMEAASRSSDSVYSVQEAGGKLFYQKLSTTKNVPVLMVREGGKDRVLLDPMAGTDGKTPRAISSYAPSPDGKFIAIHIAEGGGEIGAIRIYDVSTGKPGSDVLTPVWGEFKVGWIDDKTVTYTRLATAAPGADTMKGMVAYLHVVGTPISADKPLLGAGLPDNGFKVESAQFPVVFPDSTSRWVLAVAGNARAELPFGFGQLSDVRTGKAAWTTLAGYDDRINTGDIVGDTLYYLTSKTDEKGELRALDLKDGATLAQSRSVMKSEGRVLSSIAGTDSGLYVVTTLPSAASKMFFLPKGGGAPVEVVLPASLAIDDVSITPDRKSLTFEMSGYTQNATYYRATAGQAVALGLGNMTLPAAKARTVVEETATSADGTKVPLTIVYAGARKGPAPTVIDAYGGYGVSGTPFYSTSWTVWNQRGGVYAYCHIRGGGEMGEGWHRAGYQGNKVNAHADLIACGKRIAELGYATPKTLGIFGASAGGLLIPMAGMKAPDLFAAVVTRVGIVNGTRLAFANNGPNQFGEMGDPNTEAGFKALAAQDSTLFLKDAKGGPDFLFTIGLNDKRVDPWMSAKLVAMMRAKWGDQHLVLIRSDGKAGHGMGSTRDQSLEERADIFSFFLNRFGVAGFVK
ncbi:MAG: prolyl oligopeptidase family serine peptidase [Pseudomonadota bacterium]